MLKKKFILKFSTQEFKVIKVSKGNDPGTKVGALQIWYQSGILPAYFALLHTVSATTQVS